MNIKQYREAANLSVIEFAKLIGITRQHVYEIEKNGKFKPSAPLALRIEEATGGAVSRMELLYPESK